MMKNTEATKKSGAGGRLRKWLARIGVSLMFLLIVTGVGLAIVWKSMFEKQGDPVARNDLTNNAQEAEVDPWEQAKELLDQTDFAVSRLDSFQCELFKQERFGERLEPINRLVFKQTKEPSRIYLKWLEPFAGREVIFELHRRGNRMLLHEGGTLRRITPDLIMPTDHILAEKFSRHPVSDLRIQVIRRQLSEYRDQAEKTKSREVLVSENESLRGKPCFQIVVRFLDPSEGPKDYRRFDIFINKQTMLPMRWDRYEISEDGEERLLEYFEIVNMETSISLTDADFDPSNSNYDFRPDWVQSLRNPKTKEDE